MANFEQLLVVGGLAIGAWYAYTQGYLCGPLKLCPNSGVSTGALAPITGPGNVGNETSIPINDITWRTAGPKGPHDALGYSDDGGYGDGDYSSYAAHISIA